MFRKLKQWIAGSEISLFANELEKLVDATATQAHRIEGLQLRLERLSNRVNMRMNRAGAPRDDERDVEIMRELAVARGNTDGGSWDEPAPRGGDRWD